MEKGKYRAKISAADAMVEATRWLDGKGVSYRQLTAHHLKMGPLNYWPVTGTITIDGESCKRNVGGLAGLAAILTDELLMGL